MGTRPEPSNFKLLLDLGGAYGQRYEHAAAERCFEKAVLVCPSREAALVMAGTQYRAFDRYEMARSYSERAVKEPTVSADTCARMAEVYERFRSLDEACGLVDRALHLDPACALASMVGARLDRLSRRAEKAKRRLRGGCSLNNGAGQNLAIERRLPERDPSPRGTASWHEGLASDIVSACLRESYE